MMLFYTENIDDNIAFLGEEESLHCARVLRKRVGDEIHLVDGHGKIFVGNIISLNKKKVEVQLNRVVVEEQKMPFSVNIAIAPTKNIGRIEWFLEKSTEVGLDSVYFIETEHSERRKVRLDRLQKIVLSAMKQSKRTFLPQLNDLQKLESFLKTAPDFDQKFVAWCVEGTDNLLKNNINSNASIMVLIGPEGGFSPDEVELCKQYGYEPISLGKSRLRTETAGLMAVATVNICIY